MNIYVHIYQSIKLIGMYGFIILYLVLAQHFLWHSITDHKN